MANLMNLDVLRAGRLEARAPRYQVYTERHLDQIDVLSRLPDEERFAMRVVASVLPFRVNNYVIDELIDWDRVPDDPIYQLVFPQRGMLGPEDFTRMAAALENGADRAAVHALAQEIRKSLNPHPAGQQTLNVPTLDGERLPGMQHKYRETLLFFPSQGQVCHAYCTFCFRWAQFVGDKSLRFATNEADRLKQYLRAHREITDVLITGGDPMVMNADHLAAYLAPLVAPELDHIETIRIGTKSLTFWPHRYVSDTDADEVLRLFERLVEAGKHVALMAHYDHWREMETPVAQEAVRRIRDTGAVIRTQAPLLRWINDDPEIWARMWQAQVRLGMVPYYMFVERNTGARRYFEVPLVRGWEIHRDATGRVSGLARTARGPCMSAAPGKIEVEGTAEVAGERVFVLRMIQGRNPDWVQRPFFARYDPEATWLDQLRPAFGEPQFFFESEFERMCRRKALACGAE